MKVALVDIYIGEVLEAPQITPVHRESGGIDFIRKSPCIL